MYSIYALSDPRDQTIRYIGRSNGVMRRYQEHVRGYSFPVHNPAKKNWLRDLEQAGLQPILTILEIIDHLEQAHQREAYWIEQNLHMPLTNSHIETGTKAHKRKGTLYATRRHLILSQSELAQRSGVSPVIISRCEHGYPIHLQDVIAILDVLNTERIKWNDYHRQSFRYRGEEQPPIMLSDIDWKVEREDGI